MDALKFVKERSRMCKAHSACGGCPLERAKCSLSIGTSDAEYERIIATVEQWSKEHPLKTRQSVFLEQWPNAEFDRQGVIAINPCDVDKTICSAYNCTDNIPCDDCRREFWMQEVE